MSMIDVVADARAGRGHFQWSSVVRKHQGHELHIAVFADAMKFDGVPELDWAGNAIADNVVYDGVRLPATPAQLQQIADHLDAMLLTPIIIEELWLQADRRFDAIVNAGPPKYTIAADMGITQVHRLIEEALAKVPSESPIDIIDSVGKYWCLINGLGVATGRNRFGDKTACNFGWCSTTGSGIGVTPRVRCWQRPGFKHNLDQHDPSQTIRLMSKHARLVRPSGSDEQVHLYDIAADSRLAPLLHHEIGPLRCLRQPGVPEEPIGGTVTLPEVVITSSVPEGSA